METDYHPELDMSPLIEAQNASLYHTLIGSANWLITLGRLDIHYVANTMAWFVMAPHEGHMTAMKHAFGYLKKYHKGQLTIDPHFMDWISYNQGLQHLWQEIYPNTKEELPHDMLNPKGKPAHMEVRWSPHALHAS